MVDFKKFRHKIKNAGLAVLTMLGVVSPIMVTSVNAAGLDINTAFNEVIGSHGDAWHYSYQGGNNFNTVVDGTASADEYYTVGLDCTSGAIATISRALKKLGYNPHDYFDSLNGHLNAEYPVQLSDFFSSNIKKVADGPLSTSDLQAGDIFIYGTRGNISSQHMGVYAGDGTTVDFTSGGHGTQTYNGIAKHFPYSVGADGEAVALAEVGEVGADGVGKQITSIWRLQLNKKINVSVVKTSSCTNISKDNPLYNNLTAHFGVYKDANCTKQLTDFWTDASGKGNSGDLEVEADVNTVYVKELEAAPNYKLNTKVFTVDVSGGSGVANVGETPINDPLTIKITKVDKEGKTVTAPMAGAQFEIKYYATLDANSTEDVANLTPTRTWVIKTVEKTRGDKRAYVANLLDPDCLVSGDLYISEPGIPTMPLGCITIEEIAPVAGYTKNGGFIALNGEKVSDNTKDIIFAKYVNQNSGVSLLYGNNLSNPELNKEEASIRGGFSLTKVDDQTGRRVQNDASFAGAEFDLYYVDNKDYPGQGITVKDNKGTEYKPGDKVGHITLNENGCYKSDADYIGYGTYKLVETKCPTGMSKMADVTFNIENDNTVVELQASESVYYGDFTIHKTIMDSSSSFGENEEGAVFDVVAANYVEKYAKDPANITRDDVIAAYNHNADYTGVDADGNAVTGYTEHEFDQLTTDADGKATSRKLAYGDYYIAQVSGKENYDVINNVTHFEVTKENQATVSYEASNKPTNYVLRIVKKDAVTGQTVTLDSAAYKVKKLTDIKGNDVSDVTSEKLGLDHGYVTQTLGDGDDKTTYFAYKTVSDNANSNAEDLEEGLFYPVNSDSNYEVEKGTTALPLTLEAGTYQLEEVITPKGFVTSAEPIKFTIDDASISKVNDKNVKVIEIVQTNAPLEGELHFTKSLDEMEGADKSLVNHDLSQFGFTLYASEDILSPDDGKTVIVKAGDEAVVYNGTGTSTFAKLGEVFADSEGHVDIERLPLGHYTLVETTHPAGTVANTKSYDVVVSQNKFDKTVDAENVVAGDTVSAIEGTITNPDKLYNIENFVTKTWISKKSATTGDELPGAHLTLTDSEGKVVDEWTSTEEEHKGEGLTQGGTYILTEVISPEGYAKATSVTFTVEEEQTKVEMIDKQVGLTKKSSVDDKELPGAHIQIIDENGNIVDEWTSTEEEHWMTNLEVGKTYTMHEEGAPDGYYYSNDATFTVEDDGVTQHETMYDNIIHYQIAKVDDKNGDYVKGVELKLVDVTDKSNPVEVKLPNKGITTDKPFDLVGVLIAGHKYQLTEAEYVEGVYRVSGAVEFTVPKTGTSDAITTVTMVDETTNIAVRKVDNYGKPVAGAKMQIIEAQIAEDPDRVTDNEAVKDATDLDNAYLIDGEATGETNNDVSTQAVEGNAGKSVADSQEATKPAETNQIDAEFTADDADSQEAVKPEDGADLDDAYTLPESEIKYEAVKNEDGTDKVVYEFTTTDDVKGTDISKYVKGDGTYILREVEAPFGFEKIEDQIFTVTGKKDAPQTIVATDARQTYYVSAVKVDKADHSKLLKGAEITLYNADGTIAKDVNGKECKGLTDGKGVITWNVEYTDAGYYVQETNAPAGYKINSEHYKVELSSDFFESEKKAYQIVVEDEIKPVMGIGMDSGILAGGFGALTVLGAALATKGKKKKETKELDDSAE